MNSIVASERVKVYHNNFTSPQVFSVEEAVGIESGKLTAEDYLNKNPFFKKQRVGFVKFVDDRVIYNMFSSTKLDIDSVNNAHQTIAAKIAGYRTQIVDKYDTIKKNINILSSSVDTMAIYQNRYFSNMNVITETFDTENDITQDASPLFVDTYEQKLTLVPAKIEIISLNNASVSMVGNGAVDSLSSLNNIADGSAATFFDYRQTAGENYVYADVSIGIPGSKIVNQIVIDVNNFGTQLPLLLEDIQFTTDGTIYTSISKQVSFLSKYLVSENPQSHFVLDTLKNNGSSLFTIDFIPMSMTGVKLKFKQDQKHPLHNDYRIGINDISLRAVSFKSAGAITVKKAVDTSRLKSVALNVLSYTNIGLSALSTNWQISFDGASWINIQPVNAGGSKPEIIYVNQPWLASSISITGNTGYIYVKIAMNKSAVTGNSLPDINTSSRVDSRPMPTASNLVLKTTNSPLAATDKVSITSFVGIGIKGHNVINLGKTNNDKFFYAFKLPVGIAGTSKITVNNVSLTKYIDKTGFSNGQLLGYYIDQSINTVYINIPNPDMARAIFKEEFLKVENTRIVEYNIDNAALFATLLDSQDIKLFFDTEVFSKPSSSKIPLGYLTNGIKSDITIKKISVDGNTDRIVPVHDIITAGQTKIQLSHLPIYNNVDLPISVVGDTFHRVDFIDGFTEFMGNEFVCSIDFSHNILYLSNPLSKDMSVVYSAYDTYLLSQNDFDLITSGTVHYIVIKETIFVKNANFYVTYVANFQIDPSVYRIVDNTITFGSFDSILFNNQAYPDQKLLVSYDYKDTLKYSINEVLDYLTPSIDNFNIIYSV